MGRDRPERRKESGKGAGKGERERVARAVNQGRQRERQRQRILDGRESQENEAGRGYGGGHGKTENPGKAITILYTNAQSIISKIDELKATSQDLDPDIILLTETWCNNSIENTALALENYTLEIDLRRDRCDTANGVGGGLLVYSKQAMKILPSDKFQNSRFNQYCTFRVATTSGSLDIVLIYRPPSSGIGNIAELCEMLRATKDNTIFIGDFNLPGVDWERGHAREAKGRELLETAVEEGLDQLVTFPTHTKGNILDLLLTNCSDKILDVSDVGRLGRSDHCMIKVDTDFHRQSGKTRKEV
jgi:hypothetical protein